MYIWDNLIYFAIATSLFSFTSALISFSQRWKKYVIPMQSAALLTMLVYIVMLWTALGYPPMRTMGETRLWYSFFLILAGILTHIRYRYNWILLFTALLSTVFNTINILKPEIHSEGLMPVLQSVWFIPHVSIYMFSYAIFAFAFVLGIISIIRKDKNLSTSIDELVLVGIALFGFGMFVGALWAKQAWGNYWTWDPKETWAAITWALYLAYIHMRLQKKQNKHINNTILILAFLALQMCWYGIKFLPNVQSVHVYN